MRISFSNQDGHDGENVTLKVNLQCFKLHYSYFMLLNLSPVVSEFFWS